MTDRKKPTAGIWITVALVAVLVGYPLSFGPACWIASRNQSDDSISTAYWPIGYLMKNGGILGVPLRWYAKAGMRSLTSISVPCDSEFSTCGVSSY